MKIAKTALNLLFVTFFLISATQTKTLQKSPIGSIFAHGIADTREQAYKYHGKEVLLKPFLLFNFPDSTTSFVRVKRQYTSLGQDNEIARLNKVYQEYAIQTPEIILFGLSRGASTILNFVATHQPTQVVALVLESPFDCVESIIKKKLQQFGLSFSEGNIAWGQRVMSFIFALYNPLGIHPINVVQNIDKNIPILIICSKQDQLVPYTSSVELYKKLIASGHKKTHIRTIDFGKHSKILWDMQQETYRNCTHAFYKKYNLPYITEYADLGALIIHGTQPELT